MTRRTTENELYPGKRKIPAPFHEAHSPRLEEKDDVNIYRYEFEMPSQEHSALDSRTTRGESSSSPLNTSSTSKPVSIHSDITNSLSRNLSRSNLLNEEKTPPKSYAEFLQNKLNILGHPSADDLLLFFGEKLLGKEALRTSKKGGNDTLFLEASKQKTPARNILTSDSESSFGPVTMIRDIIKKVYNATIDSPPVKSSQEGETRNEGSAKSDFWMNLNRWIQPEKDERYIVRKDEDGSTESSHPLSQNSFDSHIQLFHPALASLYRRSPKLVQSFDKDLVAVQALVRGFKVISKYFTTLIALVQTIRGTINKDVREAGQERDNVEEYIKEKKTWEEAGFDEEAAKDIVRVCGVKLTILESRIDKLLQAFERKDLADEKAYLEYLRTTGKA